LKENPDKPKLKSADSIHENLPEEINYLLDLSDELIFRLDSSFCIKSINVNGASLLGYELAGITGIKFPDLVKPSYRESVLDFLNEALKENEIKSFETALSGKFKNDIYFRLKVKNVIEDGNVIGLIGIGKNLSAVKKLEEKISEMSEKLKETKRIIAFEQARGQQKVTLLEEFNKMKSEFISSISHELRTPLASIIGFSESISSDPAMTPEHQKEFNEVILSEGKRLAKLINDVLDMTRLETGEIDIEMTKINFINLMEKVTEKLNDEIHKKELILTREFPDEEVIIFGDKGKLIRAFTGILENAVKFTGRGGRISIFINTLYKEIEVIITDTGIGIPPKNLPYLFQKYYNSDKFRDYDSKRGLGLVFVKHIVDLHKGSITIQSEVNEGTTVIVKLLKEELK
jgi:PAS domain S-box-containing protein